MKISLGANWMPTIAGIVSAAASFVMFAQVGGYAHFPMWVMGLALFTNAGGLAALGITAKQYNVTGGTVGQPSTSTALKTANQAPAVGEDAPKPK